jgi:hypothetical protein
MGAKKIEKIREKIWYSAILFIWKLSDLLLNL